MLGFRDVIELFWKTFTSLKVAFTIIFGLALGCFWGMFFDQTLTLAQHRSEWSEAVWKLRIFEFFELHDVFHSWWFGSLTIWLMIGLIAISIDRLPKIWFDIHQPKRVLDDAHVKRLAFRSTFFVLLDSIASAELKTSTKAVLQKIIQRKGSKFYSEKSGVDQYFFNERDRYSRTGVYLIHIALVIIMASSFMTTYYGIDGMLMIPEGGEARYVRVRGPGGFIYNHDLGFSVSCEDFRLKTFIDGAPMDFESDLLVHDPEIGPMPAATKTIQVNHPLEYKGYTFYQASYQPMSGQKKVLVDICQRPGADDESIEAYQACKSSAQSIYQLQIGDKVRMMDGTVFIPLELFDDYMGLGAALRIERVTPAGERDRFVVFRNYPKFDEQVRRGDFVVGFRGEDKVYATGIQVGKSPFINVIFLGFILLFVGMYMSYFMSQRRYWMRIRDVGDRLEVTLGGAARWHIEGFRREFDEWVQWSQALAQKSERPRPSRELQEDDDD